MGTKLQELRSGCFARAMDDEPMFVLLARDVTAPTQVRAWAIQRKADISMGRKPASDMAVVEEAFATADKMEAWREQNDGAWRGGLFGQGTRQESIAIDAEFGGTEPLVAACPIPLESWRCTRGVGHDGPCEAVPMGESRDEMLRRGMLGNGS